MRKRRKLGNGPHIVREYPVSPLNGATSWNGTGEGASAWLGPCMTFLATDKKCFDGERGNEEISGVVGD